MRQSVALSQVAAILIIVAEYEQCGRFQIVMKLYSVDYRATEHLVDLPFVDVKVSVIQQGSPQYNTQICQQKLVHKVLGNPMAVP